MPSNPSLRERLEDAAKEDAAHYEGYSDLLREAAAALPDGWVMVPATATDSMCQAAHEMRLSDIPPDAETSYGPATSARAIYRAQYAAMLAASESAHNPDSSEVAHTDKPAARLPALEVLAEAWFHQREEEWDIYDLEGNPEPPCPKCVRVKIVRTAALTPAKVK